MHQPDGDNIFTDDNGDSWFQDGPPASTLKASELNAIAHELINVLKAYGISPKQTANDTYDQIAQALIARDQGKTREASVVIASSDSDENARLTADVVISTNEDASVVFNAQMVALSATGGGKISFRKGNYYCSNQITFQDDINFGGEGDASVLHNVGAITIVECNGKYNLYLHDFKIYNDGTGTIGINGNGESSNTFSNIYIENAGITTANFVGCRNLVQCYSENGSTGYSSCFDLSNCYATCSGTSWANTFGYDSCYRLSGCTAYRVMTGFRLCENMSHTNADLCNTGYTSCKDITACTATNCSKYGFVDTNGISLCNGYSCISISNVLIAVYVNCHGGTLNRAGYSSTYFRSCTPEWGSSANAFADTAAGGWNVTY